MMQASGINETTYTFHTHKKKNIYLTILVLFAHNWKIALLSV